MAERFVPISEIPFHTDRIRWASELPFKVDREIGVEPYVIRWLLQLGAISHLKIVNQENGEKSKAVFQIVGISPDGSALAGKGKVDHAQDSSSELKPGERKLTKQEIWSGMQISLNIGEIVQRMLYSGLNVKDPENWSQALDKIIKKSIREEGSKNILRTPLTNFDRAVLIFTGVYFIAANSLLGIDLSYISTLISLDLGVFLANYHNKNVENLKRGDGYRFSGFYGFEIDRLIALLLASRIKPVVKSIK